MTEPALLDKIARLTALLGDAVFPSELTDFLKNEVNFDRLNMDAVLGPNKPVPLYDNCPPEEYNIYTARYLDGLYKQDPLWQYCQKSPKSHLFTLDELSPNGFLNTKFYKDYYIETGVIDEVGFVCMLDQQKAVTLSLVRRKKQRPFSNQDIHKLRQLEKIIVALVQAHWRPIYHNLYENPNLNSINNLLDTGFKTFAKSILTPREHHITMLMLHGHTSIAIGERLGITTGTVKNHRKAIYRKLDIVNFAELFSLFIMSLRKVEQAVAADPMVLVENKQN